MNFAIKSVSLQGFKSFSKKQVFKTADSPGLYFISGDNQVEPSLGANGVGKSSVADGISYVGYNKTLKKLKAGAIKNWDSDAPCKVSLEVEKDGVNHFITRTWSPNSLKCSVDEKPAKTAKQEDIEEILGLDYETFLHTHIIGQGKKTFFDMLPEEKLKLISSVLGLDKWSSYSKKTTALMKEVDSKIRTLEKEESKIIGQLEQLNEQDFFTLSAQWEEDQQTELSDLKTTLTELSKEEVEDDRPKLEKRITTLTKRKESLERDFKELAAEKKEYRTARDDIKDEISVIQTEIRIIEKDKQKLLSVGATCKTCLQPVSKEHTDSHMESFEKSTQKKEKERDALQVELKEVDQNLDEIEEEIEEFSTKKHKLLTKIQETDYQIKDIEREILRHKKDVEKVEREVERVAAQTNPYLKKQEEVSEKKKKTKTLLARVKKALEKQSVKYDSYSFWVKGFKQVRLFLIKEALTQLEIEINNSFEQLGLHGWHVTFDIDQETTKGDLKKGFFVYIHAPHNHEPVPWGAWSGGEAQRCAIAGQMGLIDLILSRKGITSNIEIWDEPTQFLSENGIEDLLAHLKHRAFQQNKQIWLVDHRSLSFGEFDGTTKIIKDEEGSRIHQRWN